MIKFVVINNCYGGFPDDMKRQYNSIQEYKDDLNRLQSVTDDEVVEKYHGFHPLMCSNPVLYEINLADDEYFEIDEYDGMESISFHKTGDIKSTQRRCDIE